MAAWSAAQRGGGRQDFARAVAVTPRRRRRRRTSHLRMLAALIDRTWMHLERCTFNAGDLLLLKLMSFGCVVVARP